MTGGFYPSVVFATVRMIRTLQKAKTLTKELQLMSKSRDVERNFQHFTKLLKEGHKSLEKERIQHIRNALA